jgi:hypothetical protein
LAIQEVREAINWSSSDLGTTAKQSLDSFAPNSEYLEEFMGVVERYYDRIGLTNVRPQLFLVDRLPEPYADRSLAVLAADMGDYKNHGIEPGLYFLASSLKPVVTNYFLAHEAIHTYLGKISPYDSCDFFEEGIADFLSVFGCIRELLGESIARNVYLLYRLTSACGLIWDSYVDGTRQALSAALNVGMSQVVNSMKQGRPGLRSLEASTSQVRLAGTVDATERLAIQLLLDFPRYHVVPAAAYLIAQRLEDGITVAEAAKRASMTVEVAQQALDELDTRAMITRRRDGLVVTKAICQRYITLGHFRYDFR